MTYRITLLALCACVAVGCGAARSQASQTVQLGGEVTLAPGATADLQAQGLRVRFVAVTEDSRCPRDTTCVWAGEAKVGIAVHPVAHEATEVEILEGASTVAGEFRVTLVRLEPQPTSAGRIAPQDYRATLRIEKTG